MKDANLNFIEISAAIDAIGSLTTFTKVSSDESGVETPMEVPYRFTPSTRMALARNLKTLVDTQAIYLEARKGIMAQHGADGEGDMRKDLEDLQAKKESIRIVTISEDDLNLSYNDITPSCLFGLWPLIEVDA